VDPKAFTKAAKKLKLEVSAKQSAIAWAGEDRLGVAADATAKLAAAGIGVVAMQVICSGEGGRFGGLIQVAADDIKKAKKLLSA
jgi:predicted amino acid-binding ACT domain protein